MIEPIARFRNDIKCGFFKYSVLREYELFNVPSLKYSKNCTKRKKILTSREYKMNTNVKLPLINRSRSMVKLKQRIVFLIDYYFLLIKFCSVFVLLGIYLRTTFLLKLGKI